WERYLPFCKPLVTIHLTPRRGELPHGSKTAQSGGCGIGTSLYFVHWDLQRTHPTRTKAFNAQCKRHAPAFLRGALLNGRNGPGSNPGGPPKDSGHVLSPPR